MKSSFWKIEIDGVNFGFANVAKNIFENTQVFVYFVRNIFLSSYGRKANASVFGQWNWLNRKPWLLLLVVMSWNHRLMTIRPIHLSLNCHCCHHPKRMPMHWGTATAHKERQLRIPMWHTNNSKRKLKRTVGIFSQTLGNNDFVFYHFFLKHLDSTFISIPNGKFRFSIFF